MLNFEIQLRPEKEDGKKKIQILFQVRKNYAISSYKTTNVVHSITWWYNYDINSSCQLFFVNWLLAVVASCVLINLVHLPFFFCLVAERSIAFFWFDSLASQNWHFIYISDLPPLLIFIHHKNIFWVFFSFFFKYSDFVEIFVSYFLAIFCGYCVKYLTLIISNTGQNKALIQI